MPPTLVRINTEYEDTRGRWATVLRASGYLPVRVERFAGAKQDSPPFVFGDVSRPRGISCIQSDNAKSNTRTLLRNLCGLFSGVGSGPLLQCTRIPCPRARI